jgi:hypothetical protein
VSKTARSVGFALRCAGACLGSSLALAPALPAEDVAKGKFTGSSWNFEVATAFAFPSEMLLDDAKGIVLALTNDGVDEEWLSAWVDRRWVLDNMVANQNDDDRVLVAYVGFQPDGKLEGFSWYFASGDGCGFCSSGEIQSTVKLVKGRLVGTIKGEEDSYSIDLEIDVPVQPEFPGARLPAGGAEPGAAYLALRDVLYSGNRALAWDMLDSEWKEILKDRTPEGREEFFGALISEKVSEKPKIVGGYSEGDRAVLQFEAEESYGTLRGEVRMDREGGVWKYDDSWRTVKLE